MVGRRGEKCDEQVGVRFSTRKMTALLTRITITCQIVDTHSGHNQIVDTHQGHERMVDTRHEDYDQFVNTHQAHNQIVETKSGRY